MKKLVITVIGIIIIMAIAFIGINIILNKEKTLITADEFKSNMEGKGYTVEDTTKQWEMYDFINKIYTASNEQYKLTFYDFSVEEEANMFFNEVKSTFEQETEGEPKLTSIESSNYAKATLTTDTTYRYVSKINNTVLYIYADAEHKESILNSLKDLDY